MERFSFPPGPSLPAALRRAGLDFIELGTDAEYQVVAARCRAYAERLRQADPLADSCRLIEQAASPL